MKDNSLENEKAAEVTAFDILHQQHEGFDEWKSWVILDAMERYATLKTSQLKEQLEKLQGELGAVTRFRMEDAGSALEEQNLLHEKLKSSQEETSLLKSQLEEAKAANKRLIDIHNSIAAQGELEILERIKFMFELHSDHSCQTNGYRSLVKKIEDIKNNPNANQSAAGWISDEEIEKEFPISAGNNNITNHYNLHSQIGAKWMRDRLQENTKF